MIFSRLTLLPGEVQRAKLSVSAALDTGHGRLMYLHATDRRLVLSRPRFSEYLALPAFFVAGLSGLLFGVIGAALALALMAYILVGQKLHPKNALGLAEVAACTYQKGVGFFSADHVLIMSRYGQNWRLAPSGKQTSALSIVRLLETVGLVVADVPDSWSLKYL